MISSIVICGTLLEKKTSIYRYITYYDNNAFHPEKGRIESIIPIMYWSRDDKNLLFDMKAGKKIVVKGHLESNEEIGLYVLVEYLTYL